MEAINLVEEEIYNNCKLKMKSPPSLRKKNTLVCNSRKNKLRKSTLINTLKEKILHN